MSAAVLRDDVLISTLIRQPVVNEAGEKIGEIDDLIVDIQGNISAALVEVGSFIGAEEKLVAVPFNSLSIVFLAAGRPRIVAELSRPYLAEASGFKVPGPSSLGQVKDTAAALRMKAAEKASELRHRAADAVSKVAEIAVDKASDLGHKATEAASGVRKRITGSGPDLMQKAAEKFSEVGHKITDRTSSLIHKASERSLVPKFKHDEISRETGAEGRKQVAAASTVVQGLFEHEQRRS
jgi:sporulation protein YlmC with PRC-barrel domain